MDSILCAVVMQVLCKHYASNGQAGDADLNPGNKGLSRGNDVKEATGRQWQLEWIKQYNTYKYWNRALDLWTIWLLTKPLSAE